MLQETGRPLLTEAGDSLLSEPLTLFHSALPVSSGLWESPRIAVPENLHRLTIAAALPTAESPRLWFGQTLFGRQRSMLGGFRMRLYLEMDGLIGRHLLGGITEVGGPKEGRTQTDFTMTLPLICSRCERMYPPDESPQKHLRDYRHYADPWLGRRHVVVTADSIDGPAITELTVRVE